MTALPFQVHDEDLGMVAAFLVFADGAAFASSRREAGSNVLLLEVRDSFTCRWAWHEPAQAWLIARGQEELFAKLGAEPPEELVEPAHGS